MEHAAHAPDWAAALEASAAGLFMRQSLWAYPVANLLHLLGLTLLVGPLVLFDLRIIGLGRGLVSAEAASRLLTPVFLTGLALSVLTGPLLFLADAKSLAASPPLLAKLSLAALAIANGLLFRALWSRRLSELDAAPPAGAKLQAAASIALWFTVAGLGRMIAYL